MELQNLNWKTVDSENPKSLAPETRNPKKLSRKIKTYRKKKPKAWRLDSSAKNRKQLFLQKK